MMNKKILIVDDEALIRQLISDRLSKEGFETVCLPNPIEALQILENEQGKIDLVITDFKMPEMSGLDFVITASSKHPSLPIIVISGYGTNEEIINFLKNGAFDYLAKPFALKDLVQSVYRVFSETPKSDTLKNVPSSEMSTIFGKLETHIFNTRPSIIRTLKIIEELLKETVSINHKQKLQKAHDYCNEVSTSLIKITEYIKDISKK